MRSPFAYTPRRGPLQQASPGAAVAFLGALVVVAFLYSSPAVLLAALAAASVAGFLAGARRSVRASLRLGLALALLIAAVEALLVDRGETVLGLRVMVAIVVSGVYSACVDPDRVLRALRPLAARSALTATLVSRLVPVAAADAGRLRDAARLRGPGAAPVGKGPLARRLLAGSLDRAVDVAATLELRGYSLAGPRGAHRRERSRYDLRFYLVGAAVLAAAVAGKLTGADDFQTYPGIVLGFGPATLGVCVVVLTSGLAPLRRRARRPPSPTGLSRRGPRAPLTPTAVDGPMGPGRGTPLSRRILKPPAGRLSEEGSASSRAPANPAGGAPHV
jgi:energy-coupling factor transport system permease protein